MSILSSTDSGKNKRITPLVLTDELKMQFHGICKDLYYYIDQSYYIWSQYILQRNNEYFVNFEISRKKFRIPVKSFYEVKLFLDYWKSHDPKQTAQLLKQILNDLLISDYVYTE